MAKQVEEWVIIDKLPDGKNYFCGIGELKLPSGQVLRTNIWNTDIRQALPDLKTLEGGAIFTNKRIANHVFKKYIRPNSPRAYVKRLPYSIIEQYQKEVDKATDQ